MEVKEKITDCLHRPAQRFNNDSKAIEVVMDRYEEERDMAIAKILYCFVLLIGTIVLIILAIIFIC